MQEKQPIRLFYSYSHKDEKLLNKLMEHLALLRRLGVIDEWHDRKIGAGQHIDDEIDRNLPLSRVVLLLVSAAFLASDYCYTREMDRALEMDKAGEARVIPVIIRPVDWSGAPFRNLKALPKDGKPVTKWGNRDEAWADVAAGIRAAVEDLSSSSSRPNASSAPGAQHSQPSSAPVPGGSSVRDAMVHMLVDYVQSNENLCTRILQVAPEDVDGSVRFDMEPSLEIERHAPAALPELYAQIRRVGSALEEGNRLIDAVADSNRNREYPMQRPGPMLAESWKTFLYRGHGQLTNHINQEIVPQLASLRAALPQSGGQAVLEPGVRPTPGGPQMTEQPTKREVEDLANTIRAELARTPALAFVTVAQVVDNAVDSQNPRGWSVQLLNAHTGNLPKYVSTYQEWEAYKAQLMP